MAILAAAQWRSVPVASFASASNLNGGGYDGVNYPGGTDYSLEANTPGGAGGPIVSQSAGTTSGITNVFQDTTNSPFTAAMAGNALHIVSGTNFTAGWYFITTFNSSSSVTLDRNCATGAGASGVYRVGGCWADPQANTTSSGPLVPGNVVNVRGGGTDTPASDDYALGGRIASASGSSAVGYVKYVGYNGRPRISATGDRIIFNGGSYLWIENFYLISKAPGGGFGLVNPGLGTICKNVVFDQGGNDVCLTAPTANLFNEYVDCEFFSSSAVSGATAPIVISGRTATFLNCNFHDLSGGADVLQTGQGCLIANCIFAKNGGIDVNITGADSAGAVYILNNTFDGGLSDGIKIVSAAALQTTVILNNIVSNHTGVGKFGINLNFGSATANAFLAPFLNYNDLFNNTVNFNNYASQVDLSTGVTGDLTLDPQYAAQSTEGLQIGANLTAKGFPQQAFRQHKSGQTNTVRSYVSPGAVQPNPSGPVSGGLMVGQAASRAAFW